MNQEKIGKFIAECRKKQNLTQQELANRLYITDRAISKWETGKGMPDSSIMLELCKELNITVNELLSGKIIKKEDYNQKAEENLLVMTKKETIQNKKMMMYELVIGCLATLTFLSLIFIASFISLNNILKISLFILAFLVLIIGISLALKIETETGYYECKICQNKYIPKYFQVYFAMHYGTTRYLKCPKCHKRSWHKKILK